jgi:Domain of unknown function (DUF4214)
VIVARRGAERTLSLTHQQPKEKPRTETVSLKPEEFDKVWAIARDAFVVTLYCEHLGRFPEPSALRFWSFVLAHGISPANVALRIWNSPERQKVNSASRRTGGNLIRPRYPASEQREARAVSRPTTSSA